MSERDNTRCSDDKYIVNFSFKIKKRLLVIPSEGIEGNDIKIDCKTENKDKQ